MGTYCELTKRCDIACATPVTLLSPQSPMSKLSILAKGAGPGRGSTSSRGWLAIVPPNHIIPKRVRSGSLRLTFKAMRLLINNPIPPKLRPQRWSEGLKLGCVIAHPDYICFLGPLFPHSCILYRSTNTCTEHWVG